MHRQKVLYGVQLRPQLQLSVSLISSALKTFETVNEMDIEKKLFHATKSSCLSEIGTVVQTLLKKMEKQT